MSDANDLKAKSGIDTTDFKTGIAQMSRDLRVVESGFRASAASMEDWSNNEAGLELRMKALNSSIEIQQRKVAATRAEYERIKAEKGENSRAAQDLEIKLNKETETLNKMGTELRTTEDSLEELKNGTDETGNAVEETGGKFEGFKTTLGGVVGIAKTTLAGVLALGAGVAVLAGLIGGLVFSTAAGSAELVDLSAKTGISTERLQEMKFIGDQVGVTLETMTGAQARLVRSMNEGRDGTGDQADAFKSLGVSVTDAQGKLRSTQEVFDETLDALSKIENPAERDALAMSLFGKSAQELNPLIKAGSGELGRLADKAHEVGAVMSEEDVAAFEAFDDTLASLQAGLKGTLGTLAGVFLPGFQAVFDQAGGYLATFKEIVDGSNGDFGKIALGLTGLVKQIATDVAAQAPQMLKVGLEIVKSILAAITQALPSLLTAGIDILLTLINFIVENLPILIDAGIKIILTLVDALIANLPMLIDAAVQAIITLANGLTSALPVLIPSIVQAIITIVDTLIANLPLLITAAMTLIQALAEGLIIALPTLIAAIPTLIGALNDAIIPMLPLFFSMAGQIVGTLFAGIVSNIPIATAGIAKLLAIIVENLAKMPKIALEAGVNFIKGLIEGINTAKGLLFDAVVNMATEMVTSLLSSLGIQSPSKVGRGIGKNFIGSIALGGEDVMRDVERAFANMAGRMSVAAAVGMGAGTGSVSNSTANNFDIFGNVIVQGHTTPDSFGTALKGKRY